MVEGGVPFPMLSDGGGRIGTVYGVYDEAAGVNIRGRFIIDPDFVIRAKTERNRSDRYIIFILSLPVTYQKREKSIP